MPRALAFGGATAAGFAPPWLAVLGVAVVSVWAVSLAVLLCGHSSDNKAKRKPGAIAGASNMMFFDTTSGATTSGGCGGGGGGGGCGGGGGGGGGCRGGGGGGCGGGGGRGGGCGGFQNQLGKSDSARELHIFDEAIFPFQLTFVSLLSSSSVASSFYCCCDESSTVSPHSTCSIPTLCCDESSTVFALSFDNNTSHTDLDEFIPSFGSVFSVFLAI
ncbi:hypothetical protein EJB05_43439, partial [Eragrostis curvula]